MHDGEVAGRAGQVAQVVRGLATGTREAVLVSGPAGFGTSTFLDHVVTGCRACGSRVVAVSASPSYLTLPYALIIDLLRELLGAGGAATLRLAEGLPELRALVGTLGPPIGGPPLRPGLDQTRLFDAVRRVLQRAASAGGLVLVIDNIQDADEVSVHLLRYALAGNPDTPMACAVGLRADREATLKTGAAALVEWIGRSPTGLRIALEPLSRTDLTTQLVGLLAGPPPPGLLALAEAQCGGSPLLVRVLVADLRRRGVLERRAGVWLLGPVDDLVVPRDAEPVLNGMLTGIDEAARCVFQLVSVAVRPVPVEALQRACCARAGVLGAVAALVARGLCVEELTPTGYVVRVALPLLGRLVDQSLGSPRRQALRAAITRAMQGPDAFTDPTPRLCQAGAELPDREAMPLLQVALTEALAAESWRGVVTLAEELIRRAVSMGEVHLLAEFHQVRATGLEKGGHLSDAVTAWQAAATTTSADQPAERAERLRRLAEVEWREGLFAAATIHVEQAASLLSGGGHGEDDGRIKDAVVITRALFAGRAPRRTAAQTEAVHDLHALCRRTGTVQASVARQVVAASWAARDRQWQGMLRAARRACRLAEESDDPLLVGQASVCLETAQVGVVDVGCAGDIEAEADAAASAGHLSLEADHRALLAFVLVMIGDVAGGLQQADRILAIGSSLGSRGLLARGFLVRGLMQARLGHLADAISCRDEFLSCYDTAAAGLLHVNVGVGDLDAHIALHQGRLPDVLSALEDTGSPRRGHWFHANLLAGAARFGLGDGAGLAAQITDLRSIPAPVPWVGAMVARLEGLQAVLAGESDLAADRLGASSQRLADLGLVLEAAFSWIDWAELGRCGVLDADAAARVEAATAELSRMGARTAAERGRKLLRGVRTPTSAPPPHSGALSSREQQVADLVAAGLSNQEIAARLFVSTRTVTTHLTHIYRRLGLSGRTALAHHVHLAGSAQ